MSREIGENFNLIRETNKATIFMTVTCRIIQQFKLQDYGTFKKHVILKCMAQERNIWLRMRTEIPPNIFHYSMPGRLLLNACYERVQLHKSSSICYPLWANIWFPTILILYYSRTRIVFMALIFFCKLDR